MSGIGAGQTCYAAVVSDVRAVCLGTQASPASATSGGLAEPEWRLDMGSIPLPTPRPATPGGGA